jgi:hypothetical protein
MQFKCHFTIFLCIKISPFDVQYFYIPIWPIPLHCEPQVKYLVLNQNMRIGIYM